ncbi:hypothetical protein SAMN05192558_107101 [Actinokineospora alba]|uniref:Secreted protein n=1 Tax=Actinokineospora alba TaxID=504798 RepID=A0A1H0QQD0_9PSEU|nr:hypothetical protein [Actinokineospora alba]TDP70440.1 hypothetical protein C8E96_6050 [Actinokineospora alba]SDI31562.1 hypothetical protein SAMN05421871_104100 [Actinokineospora alba]SDP19567.1 hypothetical protein SAMN05192558_107101 [Actinokineospora alba]
MKKIVGTAIASLTIVAAGIGGAAPASATIAPWEVVAKTAGGTWKAFGIYEHWNDKLCVRVYNSVSSAYARVTMKVISLGDSYSWTDNGGDDVRRCLPLPDLSGESITLEVTHFATDGSTLKDLGPCFVVPDDSPFGNQAAREQL